jgi:dUTPase
MNIPIMLTEELIDVLEGHGVKPYEYKPAYAGESIGLDLFYTGKNAVLILGDKMYNYHQLGSDNMPLPGVEGKKVLLPSGVHMALPKGYVAFIKDRGSISKTGLIRRAGVIDPGYTGEVFVNLMGNDLIEPGEKLPVQLVVIKAETDYNVISKKEFETLTSEAQRGEGKTGSSD